MAYPNYPYKHGMKGTKFYAKWNAMLNRVKENSHFRSGYYERGISVCKRWQQFESYLLHVKTYGEKETILDRENNNGNYAKQNCRWATKEQQVNNTRVSVFIFYKGKVLTVSQWAREFGLTRNSLAARLRAGLSIQEALTIKKK